MRYIDADRLIDDIRPFAEYDSNRSNKDWVRRFEIAIDAQPTADVREYVRGKWIKGQELNKKDIKRPYSFDWYYCSQCKEEAYCDTDYGQQLFDFCPNCGADMR